jgi:hypothetical protein
MLVVFIATGPVQLKLILFNTFANLFLAPEMPRAFGELESIAVVSRRRRRRFQQLLLRLHLRQ